MKQIFRLALATTALLFVQGQASAQNLSSAYFLDGYAQGHELNPAKEYDRKGYFGFPLSNINIGVKGNLSLTDVLKENPNGSGLVTYLHPSLSNSEALKGFNNNNKLLSDMRIELISVGFHAFKGYNTVTVGARMNMGLNVPYELFDLTRELNNKDYNISDFGGTAMAWGEIGLGHSRQINKAWRIGGKAKILLGGAYAKLNMDNLSLNLKDENQWVATANATVEAGVKGFTWGEPKTKEYSNRYKATHPGATTYQEVDFDNADIDGPGLNGGGLAFDLGTEWNLEEQFGVKGLKVSASLLDLGFIKWKDVAVAKNNGDPFVFEGFDDIRVKNGSGTKFDDQADDLEDRLEDLYRLEDKGNKSVTNMLGATLNIAAEYTLPSYKHLKFGFLSTTRIQGVYSWNEERLAVTVSPVKMFEVSANVGVGTLGTNVGWIINFHPRGFNLFLGSDHSLLKLSKQGVPLKSNANFAMGINYPIGKSRIEKK
ncbi:MAG: hypothetical protein IJ064_06610 [Bacteroidaceae bacterium]|nr:hypothetical protein [Bacteroidaceae bacterium]